MPTSRRRADPRELASVLERLERLRVGGTPAHPNAGVSAAPAAGWVPTASESTVGAAGGGTAGVAGRASLPRLPRLAGRTLELWRARAFDPGRSGLAVLAAVALMAALGGVWYFVTARPAAGSATQVRQAAASPTGAVPSGLVNGPANGAVTGSGPPGAELSGWPTPSSGSVSGSWSGSTAAPSARTPAASIVVDVVGKVAAPGVVELPAGARVRDAVAAAGGALPGTDLTALNLASKLSDGQEIFVGIPVPSGTGAQAAGGVVGGDPNSNGGGSSGGGADAGGGAPGAPSGGSSSSVVDLNAASLADLETLPGVGPVLAQHILDWRSQHGHFTAVSQLQQVSGIGPAKYAALAPRVRV